MSIQTRSRWQQWPLHRTKKATFQLFFQSREQVVVWQAHNQRRGLVIRTLEVSPGRPVSSGLQMPGEPGHCHARTRPNGDLPKTLGQGEPLCYHSIECCFVSGHSDITQFCPWSPIAMGNYFDRAEKIPKVAQKTGTIAIFDPCSGISGTSSRRASAHPNLHERRTQPAHVRCPIAQLLI